MYLKLGWERGWKGEDVRESEREFEREREWKRGDESERVKERLKVRGWKRENERERRKEESERERMKAWMKERVRGRGRREDERERVWGRGRKRKRQWVSGRQLHLSINPLQSEPIYIQFIQINPGGCIGGRGLLRAPVDPPPHVKSWDTTFIVTNEPGKLRNWGTLHSIIL